MTKKPAPTEPKFSISSRQRRPRIKPTAGESPLMAKIGNYDPVVIHHSQECTYDLGAVTTQDDDGEDVVRELWLGSILDADVDFDANPRVSPPQLTVSRELFKGMLGVTSIRLTLEELYEQKHIAFYPQAA